MNQSYGIQLSHQELEQIAKLALHHSNAMAFEKVAMEAFQLGYKKAWEEIDLKFRALKELKAEKSGMERVK